MYLTILPPEQAIGHILRHNLADANGHKAFAKGHRLVADDLPRLAALGAREVRVAVLEPGDIHENEAARRLAQAVSGTGVVSTPPAAGRVNLFAAYDGIVSVDIESLLMINAIDGLTVATLPSNMLVNTRRRVATIKIIPFAIPTSELERAEAISQASREIINVRPLRRLKVGVLLVGSPAAQQRIECSVYPAIEARITNLGSFVLGVQYVPTEERTVAEAITKMRQNGAQMLIIAGETSIMDRDDVTPRGIRLAGGHIEHYGAPVEPGNLLLLAYLEASATEQIPVIGAPGCVRSRDTNIVDLLLPRLLAGEHITKHDIVALGHGGLLG